MAIDIDTGSPGLWNPVPLLWSQLYNQQWQTRNQRLQADRVHMIKQTIAYTPTRWLWLLTSLGFSHVSMQSLCISAESMEQFQIVARMLDVSQFEWMVPDVVKPADLDAVYVTVIRGLALMA